MARDTNKPTTRKPSTLFDRERKQMTDAGKPVPVGQKKLDKRG